MTLVIFVFTVIPPPKLHLSHHLCDTLTPIPTKPILRSICEERMALYSTTTQGQALAATTTSLKWNPC